MPPGSARSIGSPKGDMAPARPCRPGQPGTLARPQADRQADARRWPGRAGAQAVEEDHRRGPGRRAAGGPDPPDFTADATRVNSRWCGDITYVSTWEGWLYLATVIDVASRRVVGYAMADHLRTDLAADALSNAVAARAPEPGVIFHSSGAASTPPPSTPPSPLTARSRCRSAARASAGTTLSPRASSPPTRASSSTPGPGPPGPWPGGPPSSTSPGTTAPGSTPPWATRAQQTTKRSTTTASER